MYHTPTASSVDAANCDIVVMTSDTVLLPAVRCNSPETRMDAEKAVSLAHLPHLRLRLHRQRGCGLQNIAALTFPASHYENNRLL
jgi:hypothetical protein